MVFNTKVAIFTLLTALFFMSGCGDRAMEEPPPICEVDITAGECDQDFDGLSNADEKSRYFTDPLDNDTDDDGLTDGEEVLNRDDLNTTLHPTQVSDPLNPCDPDITHAMCDRDNDGLLNREEDLNMNGIMDANETNTTNPDTDGDGVKDGADKSADGNSTALLSCLPKQAVGYRDYNNSNAMWQVENCDGDDYLNGTEDNISLTPDNYLSDPYDPLDACFLFRGTVYCEVIAQDNRTWFDRDLGANAKCSSAIDHNCYGDLYQWGRGYDKHQERQSTRTQDLNPHSFPYASSSFELATSGLFDWMTGNGDENTTGFVADRNASWADKNASVVCPKGWYVPSKDEIDVVVNAEGINNATTAFNSSLKLAKAGYRSNGSETIEQEDDKGFIWTTSVAAGDKGYAFSYEDSAVRWSEAYRATGYALRCIKRIK